MPLSKRVFRLRSVYLLAFALVFSAIKVPRDLLVWTDFFIQSIRFTSYRYYTLLYFILLYQHSVNGDI
jgi:hypothetical protein